MNSKTIGIIVVVIIIIIAAAAAVVVTSDDDDDDDPITVEATEYGLVYGNADGDCDLDDTDLKIIQQIIDNESSFTDYPFADTNHDGSITQADYDMLQRMINKESMTVYIKDEINDGIAVQFPLTKVFMSGGTNSRVVINALGIASILVANATSSPDKMTETLDRDLYTLRNNGTITTVSSKATSDDQTKLAATEFQAAIVEENGMSGYASSAFQSLYSQKNAAFIQFKYDNYEETNRAIATIGILTGAEQKAQKYVDFQISVVDTIKEKEGSKYGTVTVMDIVMTNSVNGKSGDYYAMTILAGGNNLADFDASTKKFPDGSDNTWLLDPKYNPDYLLHYSSCAYNEAPTTKTLNAASENFSETAAYKADHYYIINGVLPLPVRLAITAQILYSDCFDSDWYVSVLNEYMNDILGYSNYDSSNDKVYWSTEDIKALTS